MLLNQVFIEKLALLDQDNIMLSIKRDLKIKEINIHHKLKEQEQRNLRKIISFLKLNPHRFGTDLRST